MVTSPSTAPESFNGLTHVADPHDNAQSRYGHWLLAAQESGAFTVVQSYVWQSSLGARMKPFLACWPSKASQWIRVSSSGLATAQACTILTAQPRHGETPVQLQALP